VEKKMHHRDTEATEDPVNEVTEKIIGAAIEVHKALGPGLLESAYEECFAHELALQRVAFKRQQGLAVTYKSVRLDCGYRLDFIVEGRVIVEIKAVERILPIHEAQLLTYLRLSRVKWGLLLNFHATALRHGIRRMAN
jgi:GxxExxY protein